MDIVIRSGPAFDPAVPPGTVLAAAPGTPLELPDVFGLGLTFRSASKAVTAGLEWDRVEYSAIMKSLDPAVFDDIPVLDDADELHAGVEYVFGRTTPAIGLRVGAWLDPDHQLRSEEGNSFERAFFRAGDDEIHAAAGVGLAWGEIQLDVAVDLSERVDTAAISAIYKF